MLVQMNDYVDGMEQLKLSMGYGLPENYPLGMNGLGCGGDCGCAKCSDHMGDLGCGGDCGCKKCSGMGAGATSAADDAYLNQLQAEADKSGNAQDKAALLQLRPATTLATTGNKPVDTFNAIWGTVTQTLAPLAQKYVNKPPKTKVITQAAPDYVTPAVIVGGALVAGLLFFAMARRR